MNLPDDILKHIFSYFNFCIYKNKKILKIFLLSKYWNNYYKLNYNNCIMTKTLTNYCKKHYKEIYVESKHDLWTIFIEHKLIYK